MSALVEQYVWLAKYNRWMNEKVYGAVAQLSDEERRRDVGAFFKSAQATLSHILLGDRIWLSRMGAGEMPKFKAMSDDIFPDFEDLCHERAITDTALDTFVAALTDERLNVPMSYRTSHGPAEHPTWYTLTHLFNHQTHHRGQVTTVLTQLGHDVGVTDLVALMRGLK